MKDTVIDFRQNPDPNCTLYLSSRAFQQGWVMMGQSGRIRFMCF